MLRKKNFGASEIAFFVLVRNFRDSYHYRTSVCLTVSLAITLDILALNSEQTAINFKSCLAYFFPYDLLY